MSFNSEICLFVSNFPPEPRQIVYNRILELFIPLPGFMDIHTIPQVQEAVLVEFVTNEDVENAVIIMDGLFITAGYQLNVSMVLKSDYPTVFYPEEDDLNNDWDF